MHNAEREEVSDERLVVGNNLAVHRGCRGCGSRIAGLCIVDDSVIVCGVGELDADASTVNSGYEEVIGG